MSSLSTPSEKKFFIFKKKFELKELFSRNFQKKKVELKEKKVELKELFQDFSGGQKVELKELFPNF